ncbi:von Willebrand factor A domain-containing protein 7-like [Hypomesus transpacificus]|uniref:von Willebrand factor A domain-containing protein 7-like n=1 Tax=Hypomesus transpacificus TaxID=137520 RepID=UPI001F077829|nr:von Willebrand factor A domain-containing protein 7-like [Hypomesus transpacificus]XP_046872674.1 von Willebrand factor A domain-containing protein 7-like [Hypomesus transpacificus]
MLSLVALVSLIILILDNGVLGFLRFSKDGSKGHFDITEEAVLETTLQVCIDVANTEGQNVIPPPKPLTTESVAQACSSSGSESFHRAKGDMKWKNVNVDIIHFFNPEYHFDNEEFVRGKKVITDGLAVVKYKLKQGNLEDAREKLGSIMHTVQDFYSHSNWIELGNKLPHLSLIRSDLSFGNVADKSTPTCQSCVDDDCHNNILQNILRDNILITGYFGQKSKPMGKCSHGGLADLTSRIEPTGGINKDDLKSSHGFLHATATDVAKAATRQLLEDVRSFAGDRTFLRMMGISRRSKAMCFVIDTSVSMSEDIAEVKRVASVIIDSRRGTANEPSYYILIPFNDPDFGPLTKTTDPDIFKAQINSLTAGGGGDFPEMSLSGLQLALTSAPPSSEIFLFTDAVAKDTYLAGTVLALIEQHKSVVHFLLTGSFGERRRRSGEPDQASQMGVLDPQLYRNLAQASGGLAIQVTKAQLPEATSIISDSTSSNLVTLLQAVRNHGKADHFSFLVDESVTNVTMYVTGSFPSFTLISPSGVSQSHRVVSGSLATVKTVGNLNTVKMIKQVGLWAIRMDSSEPYHLKVVGKSVINFLFDFVEETQGPDLGLSILNTRPTSASNTTMMITVTGSDSLEVTEVVLVESSGAQEVNGSVEPLGGRSFLVRMGRVPVGDYWVRLSGVNSSRVRAAPIIYRRQSSTRVRISDFTVMAVVTCNSDLSPEEPLSVFFTVSTNGMGGHITIQATNDRGFTSSFPTSLLLEAGTSAKGTALFTASTNTPMGSDVTLIVEVTAPGPADSPALQRDC